jgi:hypothetical protein
MDAKEQHRKLRMLRKALGQLREIIDELDYAGVGVPDYETVLAAVMAVKLLIPFAVLEADYLGPTQLREIENQLTEFAAAIRSKRATGS